MKVNSGKTIFNKYLSNIFNFQFIWAVYASGAIVSIFINSFRKVPTFTYGDFPTPFSEQIQIYASAMFTNIYIAIAFILTVLLVIQLIYNFMNLIFKKRSIKMKKIIINIILAFIVAISGLFVYSSLFFLVVQ